jgi:hypothetical protein
VRRAVPALLAVLGPAVLGLAACGAEDSGRPTALTPSATADVPEYAELVTTPDGDLLSFSTTEGATTATVHDPATGEPQSRVTAITGDSTPMVDLAFPLDDTLVLAGPVDATPENWTYDLQVVDPATGALRETRHVRPYPGDHLGQPTFAVRTADGHLVVSASPAGGPPVLLLVDPHTGQVVRTAEVAAVLSDTDVPEVLGLEVSPDGSWIAVAVIAGPTHAAGVLLLDAELTPVGGPARLGTSAGSDQAFGFAVGDDGTVVAGPLEGLVEVRPGGGAPRKVADRPAAAVAVVVTGRSAWVLHALSTDENAPRGLHRYDLTDGRDTGSAQLCPDGQLLTGDLARSVDGGTVYAAVTCHSEEHRLLVFPAG